MQLELYSPDEVMILELVDVRLIVDVVHLNLELLLLLEVVLSDDLLDPVRVQVVVDYLSSVDLLPHLPDALIHDREGVRLGHSVHIHQTGARD